MLNNAGGIEADVTITRFAEHEFRLTSGGNTRFRDLAFLQRSAQALNLAEAAVKIADVTEQEIVLGVMGNAARDLLKLLSQNNWHAFPFSSSQHVAIADVECVATRLSYIGEYGFELNIPVNKACLLYTSPSPRDS